VMNFALMSASLSSFFSFRSISACAL
jgi:hypothetical protein